MVKINISEHKSRRERVRKRFAREGLDGFESHEVLELLLFYCIPVKNTNEIAHRLINEFGGLSDVLEAGVPELIKRGKLSESTATFLALMPQVMRKYSKDRYKEKYQIKGSEDAGGYVTALFEGRKEEAFFAVCLNSANKVLRSVLLQEGTVNQASVYPRKIVELALQEGAVNVILAHNHPGGSLKPSVPDLQATKRVKDALNLVDVNLIDHIIVGGGRYYSLAEHSQL